MKNVLVITLATLLFAGVACAATNSLNTADIARPAVTANSQANSNCDAQGVCRSSQAELAPGEGSPMPLCPPGHNCDDLRQIAGEGSPMPLCPPGHNCDDLREIPSAGWPVAWDLALAKIG